MDRLVDGAALLLWAMPWCAGGVLLVAGIFRLGSRELHVVGVSVGMVLQVWLANLVAQAIPAPAAFWIASGIVLATGMLAFVLSRPVPLPAIRPGTWIILLGLLLLFNATGRGLGIFDDYQNLPTVSLLAAGDVPPHFALDPSLRFGYHYFLLLLAAQLMRVGNMLPWSALDLARAASLAIPLVLTAFWVYRMTRRWMAAFLGSCVLAFAGGARWMLLLLPAPLASRFSQAITLIGSASTSAASFADAMVSAWKIDGAGPIPFPFAFYSGINQPYIMLYTGIAGSGILILLLLLMTAQRWRNAGAAIVSTALLAALAIANELAFLLLGLGIVVAALVWAARDRGRVRPRRLTVWLGICFGALVIACTQGGLITEAIAAGFHPSSASASYFDPTPALVWPPAIVSAHFGSLSLLNPAQLIVALLEIGPIILVTPLVLGRGRSAIRRGRWVEAGFIASSVGTLGALFLSFRGPLFSAAPRLLSGWLLACTFYFVPLLWFWTKSRSATWRVGALAVGVASGLGGIVLFAIQLAAIQRPVYSTFITQLDAKMAEDNWNRLPPGALVFDPLVYRAPTVLGRPTRSSPSWYSRLPEWERLRDAADPVELRSAGFTHMYIDGAFWEGLAPYQQYLLSEPCVVKLDQVAGYRSESDYTKDFRWLLDIESCK